MRTGRFQFVWWGWRRHVGFHRWPGNWAAIYRWSLDLGPLEIRRWEKPPRAAKEAPK